MDGDSYKNQSTIVNTKAGGVMKVASLTNSEYWALRNQLFRFVYDTQSAPLASASAHWYRLTVPSGFLAQITHRNLMPNIAGLDYQIFTGTLGFSVVATANKYNVDRTSTVTTTAKLEQISTPTTTGDWFDTPILSGAGASAGQSGRPAGTQSSDDGYDLYPAGEYFIKVNNFSGSANRYVLRLTVAIIPI